jgi:hypothetical protein
MSQVFIVVSMILFLPVTGCDSRSQGYRGTQTSGTTSAVESQDSKVSVEDSAKDKSTADQTEGQASPPAPGQRPPTDYCGSLSIVGGSPVTMNEMVAKSTVRLIIGDGSCTGTLIGPNQISTAAHCLEQNPTVATIQIQFGIVPAADPNVKVKGYAVHPDYKGLDIGPNGYPAARLFDVAVISFEGKIPAGYAIAPVGSTANLQAGTEVILAGYGAYSDNDMQERPLTQVKKAVALFDRTYKEIQLAVGGQQGGCYGDSGGPSYILSDNGMCLKTLSTTTGPGRSGDGTCAQGSGTLMDITAHQGWMSCAFEKLGSPLAYLLKDESKDACDRTTATR